MEQNELQKEKVGFLPSKKALSAIVIVVAIVVATIITFGGKTANKAIESVGSIVSGKEIKIPENPNWQKDLDLTGNKTLIEGGLEENTLTDNISVSLISNYIDLKQTNQFNSDTRDELINQAVNYVGESNKKDFGEVKLKIIPDNGWFGIATYGEELGITLFNSLPQKPQNEINIISRAFENKDPSEIAKLNSIITSYKNLETKLMEIKIPKTFTRSHTDLVLGLREVVYGLEEIQLIFEDPIKSMLGLQTYQEGGLKFSKALQATIAYIKNSNYDYKQGSGGYYLLNGL